MKEPSSGLKKGASGLLKLRPVVDLIRDPLLVREIGKLGIPRDSEKGTKGALGIPALGNSKGMIGTRGIPRDSQKATIERDPRDSKQGT